MGNPWKKVITFENASLNSALNGAEIANNELQTVLEGIFDNGVLEKAPGAAIVGTAHSSGLPVTGVFRSSDALGNKVLLRVVNGILQRWTGSAWTDVQTGLTIGVPYDFLNVDDKTVIVNGYDDALQFDPSDNSIKKLGLEPPRFYKKVSYFETDETALWALGTGHAFNSVFYRIEERTGTSKRSLYITAGAAATLTSTLTYAAAKDFSQYANGISISNDDFFCLSILHRKRDYIDAILIDFITSTNNYYRLTIDGTELDPIAARDNVWTNIAAKKSRFVATGSPSWANITKFAVSMVGQTGTAEAYVDNCYWKNPPIEATKYKKMIDNFEGLVNSWTVSGGTVADNLDETKLREGTKSLKVTRSGAATTLYKNVTAIDLSQFIDGVLSQTSDEISIWANFDVTANLTSITVKLFSDITGGSEKYFYKTYTVSGGDINKTATGAWTQLHGAKSTFTDVGTSNWAAIIRIQLEIVSTGALNVYLDDWCLQEGTLLYQLSTMENTETWVWGTAGSGGFNTDPTYKSQGNSSIYMRVANNSAYTLSRVLSSPINLNQFPGGEASGDSDIIVLWLWWAYFDYIKSIKVQVDCNAGDFSTDYYEHEIFPQDLADILNMSGSEALALSFKSTEIEIKKSAFTKFGDTGGKNWSTAKGYRFVVTATDTAFFGLLVYFDNLHMRRRRGLSGIYQWACVFGSADGVKSAISEWSEQVTFEGTKALLRLLPISADTNVSVREFYRKGGALGNNARLDFTIYDNATATYFSETSDDLLGILLDPNVIPSGTIRVPYGAKLGPKFKGEYILYRDPNDLKSLYYSLPGEVWGWSELQVFTLESDLLDCFIIDDILFLNTKNGIKSLSIPLSQTSAEDFQERGLIKNSMGPWASCAVEDARAVVSYDGVYIFTGNGFEYISEQVKNYFDSANYDLSEAVAFYRKRHLYISIITTGGARKLLDYDVQKKSWRTSDIICNCFCEFDGIGDNAEIYFGDRLGAVYQFDTGYATTMDIITKDFSAKDVLPAAIITPFDEIELHEVWLLARSASTTPGTITVTFRVNQTASYGSISKSVPDGTIKTALTAAYDLYPIQLLGIENMIKGSKIGLRLQHSTAKHIAIQAILMIGEVSPLQRVYEE